MYEAFRQAKRVLRGGAALLLVLLLGLELLMVPASAAQTSARRLVPVGHTVGIKLFSHGVLVARLSPGSTPAKACGLRPGDVILQCGGRGVSTVEEFREIVQQSGGEPVELLVRREGRQRKLTAEPVKNGQGSLSLGAWVRDSMAGIGTVTYYDPATGGFGALGHGITDVDTAQLMPFSSGSILPSRVKAVKRGTVGEAGELRGDFALETTLGSLRANTDRGIFGTAERPLVLEDEQAALPVAGPETVQPGPAVIRSNVEGDAVREYRIELVKVFTNSEDGRDLLLRVTDPALLKKTGGIVQGMSGSPIIQNGRLVGAVTHVLVNDPTQGYGIFIENMLTAAE